MTNRFRTPRPLALLLASAALPLLAPLAAQAQTGGFALQVAPADEYGYLPRTEIRAFGTGIEPASAYVRGCAGFVAGDAAAALIDVVQPLPSLALTASGEGVQALVVGTPDGLYRCVLADDRGYGSVTLPAIAAGRLQVLVATAEGASYDARVFAHDAPVSAIELFGLDLARLGAPRQGRADFTAQPDAPQTLVADAPLVARDVFLPLSTEYCAGYGSLDAPDFVLTLPGEVPELSIFAQSVRDLTLAVIGPDGTVLCNDDFSDLNPAVVYGPAAAGDYAIFVGGYSQGDGDFYTLSASAGEPAMASGGSIPFGAEPRQARVAFDIDTAVVGQVLHEGTLSALDPLENLPMGSFCPGFVDLSAPDYVMSLDRPDLMISLYARSETDLVLAVRSPDGAWFCNDDSFQLNPAVVIGNAPVGDYEIFVGGFSQGSTGAFTLMTALGDPNWMLSGTGGAAAPDTFNLDATPLYGTVAFDARTIIDPRILLDVRPSSHDMFQNGSGCAGFTDGSAPDLVVVAGEDLAQLMIYLVSDADGTLAVVGPDGALTCNDDFEELNPAVVLTNPAPGPYRVFAGSYDGAGMRATLGVTRSAPLWAMDSVQ